MHFLPWIIIAASRDKRKSLIQQVDCYLRYSKQTPNVTQLLTAKLKLSSNFLFLVILLLPKTGE